jgi:L,D-transpeptidase YcfS
MSIPPYAFAYLFLTLSSCIYARTYTLDPASPMVGATTHAMINTKDNLAEVAYHLGIGADNLIASNPNIPLHNTPAGSQFLLPTEYILPSIQNHVVINLAEKRLYYFDNNKKVHIFPIGIGRVGHDSILGQFKITEKRTDPCWTVPHSVIKEEKRKGVTLPAVIEAGPDNPLGKYAIRLSLSSILIHGTNYPPSVGKRSTSGCFSLYSDDIKALYHLVTLKTPVTVINEPIKIAKTPRGLYIESHPTLDQTQNHHFKHPTKKEINANIDYVLYQYPDADPLALYAIFSQNMGIPILAANPHAHNL